MARQAQGFQRKPTPCLASVTTSLRKDSTVSTLGAIPFPQGPCNGNREPSPRQAGLPSPYCLTAGFTHLTFQTGPILIRSQFGLQTTKTAGFSDSTRNRLPKRRADTKFRRKGSRRICRCPRPKLGTRPAPGQGPEPITPNPGLDMRLDTGRAVTTAARLAGTNIQPVLRHPVVAGLSCISIRIPLPSTSITKLHPRPARCQATRSDKPTPALTPRIPDRRVMAISRSIIGLRLCGVFVDRTCPPSAVMAARQVETNQQSTMPGFR